MATRVLDNADGGNEPDSPVAVIDSERGMVRLSLTGVVAWMTPQQARRLADCLGSEADTADDQ